LHQLTETLTQQECLSAKPSVVFQALTDPAMQQKWTGARATGRAQVGKRFTVFDEYISGRYLDLQPGRRILKEWQTVHWHLNAPPSIVEITLEETGGEETLLTMVQSLIPSGQTDSIKQEWRERYWKPLGTYLATLNNT
jgi:uncharacterized protein YndB with AHSA1/START domain